MKICESCSFPMNKIEDFGGKNFDSKYCKYCAPDGKLRSKQDVRNGWIKVTMMKEKLSEEEAAKKVDEKMKKMPAWKK
ncbi:MAG: hypothetical protein JXA94_03970 [Parachlamydiales bacterium]|nr:hypothetical protein [Parachlamydiales bacterium]